MQKKRVFISSVQSEFAAERQMLFDYLITDALLGKFFEPFVFENIPAMTVTPVTVFLHEVEQCDIYLGIFGEKYGFEDTEGVSPTEREYDRASEQYKTRLIYIKNAQIRDEKEILLIKKAEKELVRKEFSDINELKTAVYSSLVRYLEEQELLRLLPFDATVNNYADIHDIDERKVIEFIRVARIKRSFPFDETSDFKTVLSHLNLVNDERVTNAAILLFGKDPQKFMLTSAVKCCQFYGNKIEKPIPSYHIYYGDIFQLIDQAVSFVMSRVDAKVGARDKSVSVDIDLELPQEAVKEAIVNAVCHRDYTSNASIQVMLFRDRLEIWNPGRLPYGLTVEMLRGHHKSIPANPLLARPMYLYGSIEQVGTGTEMIVNQCISKGLKKPLFVQDVDFSVILYRPDSEVNDQVDAPVVNEHVIEKIIIESDIEKSRVKSREESRVKSREESRVKSREKNGKQSREKILNLIKKDAFITQNKMVELTGLSIKGVEKNIRLLKTEGLLERVGPNKGGYWKIIEK